MSRLLFETNDGQQHEIELETIKASGLSESDVFLVRYEVGNAPPADTSYALENLRDVFKSYFPNNKILIVATRNGVDDIEIEIVKEQE